MNLSSQTVQAVAAQKTYTGTGRFTAAAGQNLKVEVSPGGEEVLDVTVPGGKEWEVTLSVNIQESNV